MSITRLCLLLFFIIVLVTGCKKDDPKPLGSEINSILLAGDKGKFKSWRITDASSQIGTDPAQQYIEPPCLTDNIYTFLHDDPQSYQATEGVTKCDPSDPDTIESGTWAFTADGKMIIVLSNNVPQSSGSFFSYMSFPFPSVVTSITDSTMQLKMTAMQQQGNSMVTTVYIFNFVKV